MTLMLFFVNSGKCRVQGLSRLRKENDYELLPTNSRNLQNKRGNQGYKLGSLVRLMIFILVFYFTMIIFDYYT